MVGRERERARPGREPRSRRQSGNESAQVEQQRSRPRPGARKRVPHRAAPAEAAKAAARNAATRPRAWSPGFSTSSRPGLDAVAPALREVRARGTRAGVPDAHGGVEDDASRRRRAPGGRSPCPRRCSRRTRRSRRAPRTVSRRTKRLQSATSCADRTGPAARIPLVGRDAAADPGVARRRFGEALAVGRVARPGIGPADDVGRRRRAAAPAASQPGSAVASSSRNARTLSPRLACRGVAAPGRIPRRRPGSSGPGRRGRRPPAAAPSRRRPRSAGPPRWRRRASEGTPAAASRTRSEAMRTETAGSTARS